MTGVPECFVSFSEQGEEEDACFVARLPSEATSAEAPLSEAMLVVAPLSEETSAEAPPVDALSPEEKGLVDASKPHAEVLQDPPFLPHQPEHSSDSPIVEQAPVAEPFSFLPS